LFLNIVDPRRDISAFENIIKIKFEKNCFQNNDFGFADLRKNNENNSFFELINNQNNFENLQAIIINFNEKQKF
jgi:hypothetical protein